MPMILLSDYFWAIDTISKIGVSKFDDICVSFEMNLKVQGLGIVMRIIFFNSIPFLENNIHDLHWKMIKRSLIKMVTKKKKPNFVHFETLWVKKIRF
jgi:hypothetical protein